MTILGRERDGGERREPAHTRLRVDCLSTQSATSSKHSKVPRGLEHNLMVIDSAELERPKRREWSVSLLTATGLRVADEPNVQALHRGGPAMLPVATHNQVPDAPDVVLFEQADGQ